MRTEELEAYMLSDPYIRRYYGGVVALDRLPSVITKPSIFIVNSDTADMPGRHWFAVFFNPTVNEHFDSAGFFPSLTLEASLIAHGPTFQYNNRRVQDYHSNTCGLFCLFYCYFRCRGHSFRDIMQMFSSNLQINEHVVETFYNVTRKR